MSIKVIYSNGKTGSVTAAMLDYLLESDRVVSFRRQDGWVRPGCDQIRSRNTLVFSIPERRSSMHMLLTSITPLPLGELH